MDEEGGNGTGTNGRGSSNVLYLSTYSIYGVRSTYGSIPTSTVLYLAQYSTHHTERRDTLRSTEYFTGYTSEDKRSMMTNKLSHKFEFLDVNCQLSIVNVMHPPLLYHSTHPVPSYLRLRRLRLGGESHHSHTKDSVVRQPLIPSFTLCYAGWVG